MVDIQKSKSVHECSLSAWRCFQVWGKLSWNNEDDDKERNSDDFVANLGEKKIILLLEWKW